MYFRRIVRPALTGLLFIGGIACAAGPAQAPRLAALALIQPGQWQLHETGKAGTPQSLCVADPRLLLQLRHRSAQCSRFVIADQPDSVTIHYTCPGAGHGRTTLTVETPRLVRIETQGVADNGPFAFDYEGRRIGACAGPTAASGSGGPGAR